MNISELFLKDIHRNINGVIKVGQLDSDNIRQELEEYVITHELNKHFCSFFERYTTALDTPTDKMGVWISGFFGSGKSHFLKILSYLLDNRPVGNRHALDYFNQERVRDPMLHASITKAVRNSTDVILFNIDSKADANSKNDKESIVKVFQKVFDEHLGYFGTVPAIAEFERQLDQQGKYVAFQEEFKQVSGLDWKENRDTWGFCQDEISTALQTVTGMSAEAASRLLDFNEQNYSLSSEKFARLVKQYLDKKSTHYRLLFMVDEVGQYVGDDSNLMLNLQTVVEDLGIYCQGRAWVVVTSQEAMDQITKNRIKGQDFSKIIGRFSRPLSLSSANTDEVIKLRLLKKKEAATQCLEALYYQKVAILKNQILFTDSAELPGYRNAEEFVAAYPFIPYQFNLLQKVFTVIRMMGAAGKHLASGERSLLDAFQLASKAVAGQELGGLVPFNTFYLAVEGFLDSTISQVIDQAARNSQLQPFDIDLLKTLFMIKYVQEIRANLDNLTTLCLNNIDQDKLALKAQVEAALNRLEKQTLIQRVGDEYNFLTYEEQDIGREIKNTEIDPSDVTAELQKLVWDSLFTEKKIRYDQRHQYSFNRKLDDQSYGLQTSDLTLHIITPYADRYTQLQQDATCILTTGTAQEVLVRLGDDQTLLDELTELVKTDKYIRRKNSSTLSTSVQTILTTRSEGNSRRKERITTTLQDLIERADVFACGSKVEISTRDSKNVLTEGLTYLIDNVYNKLNYVNSGFETEEQVSNAFCREHQEQNTSGQAFNAAAHGEMLTWLNDEARTHRQVTIKSLRDKFEVRPYGWSEFDILGVMAELVNQGKLELRLAQGTVNSQEPGLVAKLRSRKGLSEYTVRLGEVINPASLRVAKDLANDLLEITPPNDPLKLFEVYQNNFKVKQAELETWLAQAQLEGLPFIKLLETHLTLVKELTSKESPAEFYNAVRHHQDDLENLIEDGQKLKSFFTGQVKVFEQAKQDLKFLELELRHINDAELLQRVETVRQILAMADPTAKIPQLPMLLQPVKDKAREVLQRQIEQALLISEDIKQQLVEYVKAGYPTQQIDLGQYFTEIEGAISMIKNATNIDSAIARQSELEGFVNKFKQKIDAVAAQIINSAKEKTDSYQVNSLKAIVPVRVVSYAPKPFLETAEDVESYLAALRGALLEEIEQNRRVRLE
ncbi:BREX system P-loop protein BrxC [Microcoleus sp. D2_18a_D3]|uniref:BREX system P-loop protein BrxC n=1 Tax=Microcoleus sp. D2_18a_D3 TaxID=3055330 RepID=UPI002FD695D4